MGFLIEKVKEYKSLANKELSYRGLWIPCDVLQKTDFFKDWDMNCIPFKKDKDDKTGKHVQFVFPRQFYAPMDQRGELYEVGSMKDILLATGRSIANEKTNTDEGRKMGGTTNGFTSTGRLDERNGWTD